MDSTDVFFGVMMAVVIGALVGCFVILPIVVVMDYNKPFNAYASVTGELVAVETDYFGATTFIVQQSNLQRMSFSVGRVPIDIDYGLIGQQVIIVYERDVACYIAKLEPVQ